MPAELSFAQCLLAVADAMPTNICLVDGNVQRTVADLAAASSRAAQVFAGAGAGIERERSHLNLWESGQAHVGLLLRNGPEYIEAMFGAALARAASFNLNFRYTVGELVEVLADARPRVVVVHDEFAATARQAIDEIPGVELFLQVRDRTRAPLVRDAVRWDEALAAAPTTPPRADWSPDDLYVLFTGGTTGKPKGVLWRQGDALVGAFRVVGRDGTPFASAAAVAVDALARPRQKVVLPAPPLIHGAAQWMTVGALLTGGRVVFCGGASFDPRSALATMEREGVSEVLLVGDAFARPLADALEAAGGPPPSLRAVLNGGAAMSAAVRDRLLRAAPGIRIIDSMGSSESGLQAVRRFDQSNRDSELKPAEGNVVLSDDRTRILGPGDSETGWLARSGRIPLGYLNDEAKTARTFPVVSGARYVIPGDRARMLPDGTVAVLGREATTINSGGEKIFAEEVERALLAHPSVRDALIIGRPSEQWGEAVVAIVAADGPLDEAELIGRAAESIARYKLPKRVVFVDTVPRGPAGKADHRTAQRLLDLTETGPVL